MVAGTTRKPIAAVLAAVLAFAVAGCEDEDPCDTGQREVGTTCQDIPDAGPGDAPGDGAPDGDAAAGEGGFGQTCSGSADCTAPADFCAPNPAGEDFCTAIGCDVAPAICPDGWICFDATPFGGEHLCSPPP